MPETENSDEYDWYGPDAATLGDRITVARETAGMDQNALARRLGVRVSSVKSWEEDRSEPRANRLQMLSGILNVSLPWLLNGQGDGIDGPNEEEPLPPSVTQILTELRSLKVDMLENSKKLGQLEKRLRSTLKDGQE